MSSISSIEEQLRAAVQTCGLTFYRLSIESGVDQGCLAQFARGQRGFRLSTAARLARALGLELRPRAETQDEKGR